MCRRRSSSRFQCTRSNRSAPTKLLGWSMSWPRKVPSWRPNNKKNPWSSRSSKRRNSSQTSRREQSRSFTRNLTLIKLSELHFGLIWQTVRVSSWHKLKLQILSSLRKFIGFVRTYDLSFWTFNFEYILPSIWAYCLPFRWAFFAIKWFAVDNIGNILKDMLKNRQNLLCRL